MAVVGQQLLAPESGWRRYDNTNPFIKYSESTSFTPSNATTYGGTIFYGKMSVKLSFKGNSIRILAYSNISAGYSRNVNIKIDGNVYSYDNAPTSTILGQVIVFEIKNLNNGIHIVEINSDKSQVINIDAIDIDEDGELIRHDYFENTHLDEPLRKYGVAHFGFDEASGNVTDKLGSNYVGAVTGATRVQGWNGEGNAMNFNDNQYVQLNDKIIPTTERTIRFKIKTSATTLQSFLDNCNSTSTNYGFSLYINTDGTIGSNTVRNNGAFDAMFPTIKSDVKVNDGKWHDIILTWNGKAGEEVILYVDEKISCKVIAKTDDFSPSYNLRIGRLYNQTANLFYGQLDDFQVFAKVLTPNDFTQKRVAIKTTDNKNLVLSTESGRVKEIPSIDEVDLINQGYTWKEIDEAVDRTGIDFTQTTTEYEKVNKTNLPLGSGKMFTIPLDSFKTIKVEGNY